ncbi:MAG: hypothetical protein ABR867_01575 [Nitrososphaerales archaeon]|jgi:flagellar capping protein FliD
MKISAVALSVLVLGIVCAGFGLYFVEAYSPLSHPVSDPNVILWYPIGLALMLGGVACEVAGLLEVEMASLKRKVNELDGKAGQLTGRVAELTGRVAELTGRVAELTGKMGTLTETVDRLGRKTDKLTKKTDELTTKMGKFTTTTKAEFKKLSAILKKRKGA